MDTLRLVLKRIGRTGLILGLKYDGAARWEFDNRHTRLATIGEATAGYLAARELDADTTVDDYGERVRNDDMI